MEKTVFYILELKKLFKIIADTGIHGLIIGADCTIPSDINHERIEWVREAAIL